jgi:hypothetical protein
MSDTVSADATCELAEAAATFLESPSIPRLAYLLSACEEYHAAFGHDDTRAVKEAKHLVRLLSEELRP